MSCSKRSSDGIRPTGLAGDAAADVPADVMGVVMVELGLVSLFETDGVDILAARVRRSVTQQCGVTTLTAGLTESR